MARATIVSNQFACPRATRTCVRQPLASWEWQSACSGAPATIDCGHASNGWATRAALPARPPQPLRRLNHRMPINSARIIFSFRCVRKKRSSCQRVRRDPSPPHPPSSMLDPWWHARRCKDERFFRNGHSPPTNLKLNIDPWGRGGGFTTTRRQMSVFFARTGPGTLECFLCHKPPEDPPASWGTTTSRKRVAAFQETWEALR